jgi:hypothetical protein
MLVRVKEITYYEHGIIKKIKTDQKNILVWQFKWLLGRYLSQEFARSECHGGLKVTVLFFNSLIISSQWSVSPVWYW